MIELLVVVLIIGILAAIALPQYQKAIWKSRAAEPLQLVRNLADSEERYFLATGSYTSNFDDLDITFPSLPLAGVSTFDWNTDRVNANDNMGLILNPGSFGGRVIAFLRTGKYAGGTFIYFLRHGVYDIGSLKRGHIYCAEVYSPTSAAATEKFCKNVMGISAAPVNFHSAYYYPLP